jgi:hypothetical protein
MLLCTHVQYLLLELEICNQTKFPFPLQAPVFHAWGENYCTNFDSAFNKKASSVRYKFVFQLNSIWAILKLLWKLFNLITDNVFMWLMWSNWPRLTKSKITGNEILFISERLLIANIWLMWSLWLCPKMII